MYYVYRVNNWSWFVTRTPNTEYELLGTFDSKAAADSFVDSLIDE